MGVIKKIHDVSVQIRRYPHLEFDEATAMLNVSIHHNAKCEDVVREILHYKLLEVEKAIFNDPATIVFWKDGTKTVVKCQDGDEFSKEQGLAMAICKKAFGNKGRYNEVFKKWCE